MAKVCIICRGAHGYTRCPAPLDVPSTPKKDGEDEFSYHRRLRYNAYMKAWMALHPDVKERRKDALRAARRTEGSLLHANEKARSRRKGARRSEMVEQIKSHPCMDCGGLFPTCVMDFDHRDPTTKDRRFKSPGMMAARTSFSAYLAEIKKCDLVCANCHRVRTHMRDSWQPLGARGSSRV